MKSAYKNNWSKKKNEEVNISKKEEWMNEKESKSNNFSRIFCFQGFRVGSNEHQLLNRLRTQTVPFFRVDEPTLWERSFTRRTWTRERKQFQGQFLKTRIVLTLHFPECQHGPLIEVVWTYGWLSFFLLFSLLPLFSLSSLHLLSIFSNPCLPASRRLCGWFCRMRTYHPHRKFRMKEKRRAFFFQRLCLLVVGWGLMEIEKRRWERRREQREWRRGRTEASVCT